VQRFLRHKSIATTMSYDSTGDKRFEQAVACWQAVLATVQIPRTYFIVTDLVQLVRNQ
jgi:uncharacterized membrane protein